jgi:hypothetical protein
MKKFTIIVFYEKFLCRNFYDYFKAQFISYLLRFLAIYLNMNFLFIEDDRPEQGF